MKISILVPVYNEENTVKELLNKLLNLNIEQKEIIVIDDGSTDNTKNILLNFNNNYVKIIYHNKNQGKGKAIQTGLEIATGDIIAIQDADLEYAPEQLVELLKVFDSDSSIDAVYGSRFLKKNPNIYKRFLLGNKFLTYLINFLYNSNYTDTYTCYKLIKRDIMKKLNLKSKRYEIEAEISIKLAKQKCKIIEIPICYNPRTIKQGKKIGFKDAIKGIITILKFFQPNLHYSR